MTIGTSYPDQLARVERFLVRIEGPEGSSTDYDDDFWSFFQHCWHLKDWILNDDAAPAKMRESVMAFVKANQALQICADLANRSKHLRVEAKRGRPPWVGAAPVARNVTIMLHNDRAAESQSEHVIALQDGTRVVGLDVAREAVSAWQTFIAASAGVSTA